MKKSAVLLILFLLSSCEDPNYCTDVIKGKPDDNLISESDMGIVRSLFSTNNLSLENFVVYHLQKDNSGNRHVRCYQYVNNLQVFTDEVVFHFNSLNHYYFLSGEIIPEIDISPSPKMNLNEIIEFFLECVDDHGLYSSKRLISDCFYCEIGYYDLNTGRGNSTHNFKLAWKVRPKDSMFPYAFINDTDRSLIYYDDAIID